MAFSFYFHKTPSRKSSFCWILRHFFFAFLFKKSVISSEKRLDENGNVVGHASGALVDYTDRRFLLSVAHAVRLGASGRVIELGYYPERGTVIFRPNGFGYAWKFTHSTKQMREIDLCLAEVPRDLDSKYEDRTPRGLFDQRPHHVFRPNFSAGPDPQGVFAFSG